MYVKMYGLYYIDGKSNYFINNFSRYMYFILRFIYVKMYINVVY